MKLSKPKEQDLLIGKLNSRRQSTEEPMRMQVKTLTETKPTTRRELTWKPLHSLISVKITSVKLTPPIRLLKP